MSFRSCRRGPENSNQVTSSAAVRASVWGVASDADATGRPEFQRTAALLFAKGLQERRPIEYHLGDDIAAIVHPDRPPGERHTTFGRRIGLRVSEIAFGTATFGTKWPSGADEQTSARIFTTVAEAGGTYQRGESERFLATAAESWRRLRSVAAVVYSGRARPSPSRFPAWRRRGNSRVAHSARCG
ncbi:hypothetical protein [Actinoplanes sp. HUAS TT8]|uniref:hypothetical protein n=1 Tax=Actinoplanes sp. HUAS TT8 TaxID=3447453 RepID=UPI003F51CE7B